MGCRIQTEKVLNKRESSRTVVETVGMIVTFFPGYIITHEWAESFKDVITCFI